MSAVPLLTRTFMLNRVRAQKKTRYLTYGISVLIILMMYYFTQSRAAQVEPSAGVVEFSAWRILAGLTFTIMAMAMAEMGSDAEQEFLAAQGISGSSYLWAKWLDLGARSLPWLLWGMSWAVATASTMTEQPYSTLVALSVALFVYALALGGLVGFGLETVLRRLKNGQQTNRGIAMFAPFIMVIVMMGMGRNMTPPAILRPLGGLTPIGHYMDVVFEGSMGMKAHLAAVGTVLPWLVGLWLVGLVWSFRREARGLSGASRQPGPQREHVVRFTRSPYLTKDLVMLRRYRFTVFRGVAAAGFLVIPFTFMNTQTEMPAFVRFFEVMIVVAASGMMFGLVLPAMDREVLWLIRSTGRLRDYVLHKFALVSLLTLLFSTVIIVPLTFTLNLPLMVVAPLTVVGSGLVGSITLIGSALAMKMGVDMVTRPDANIVMGVMLVFGLYLTTAVLGYLVSWGLLVGFLLMWGVMAAAALGVALYLFDRLELG